jgi:hypothetical protein
MTDGRNFETAYEREIENFDCREKGVQHADIMAALVLKETLEKLHRGEINFQNTKGLDGDHADLRSLKYAKN